MPSSMLKSQIKKIMKQNSTRIVVCMDDTHGFGPPWSVIDQWRGVKTLLFCLGAAYNVSSMEDIEIS